ncbi:helix-turn-helix domain-containing protein [Acidianus brierleyi]|uniref:Putative HTH-type transcriptional regulatory protein DFR85_10765 n=1 Tax=Acidianus brierleyi TaxID=41673 RepID=A0A2U9IGC0_9CREN|nr:helix-turn-helix domain-containing protein [Acidianus brierleyi]AWR95005.1 helix-turn-helix domain-containing protein [Acidianus brierleyi]
MEHNIQHIADILENEGLDYSIINYPEKNKKSIDIIVTYDSKRLVIKVSTDKISKEELMDLEKFSYIAESFPIIITDETEEDIALQKDKVVGLSLDGLKRVIEGDKIYVYRTRGGMFVRIRSDVLRRKREEMKYSMGDLAKMLGVSRKTIYDYENGESDVSIEIAEKLVDIFGPDVIGDIFQDLPTRIENFDIDFKKDKGYLHLLDILSAEGFNVARLRLTAADIIAAKDGQKLLVTMEPKKQDFALKKINEAHKIATKFKLNLIIVSKTSSFAKELEKDGFKVYLENELDSLKDEIKGD